MGEIPVNKCDGCPLSMTSAHIRWCVASGQPICDNAGDWPDKIPDSCPLREEHVVVHLKIEEAGDE